MHIREFRTELMQGYTYRGGSKRKIKVHKLQSNKLEVNLGAKEIFEWSGSPLEVTQDLPPSGLSYCPIIDIGYWILVERRCIVS